MLAALARELKRKDARFVAVEDGVLTFRTWWWASWNPIRHVHRGSIRAQADEQGLVLRYEIDVRRSVIGSYLFYIAFFFGFVRPGGWEIPVLLAFCALLPSLMYLMQPFLFEMMLQEVPIPGYLVRPRLDPTP